MSQNCRIYKYPLILFYNGVRNREENILTCKICSRDIRRTGARNHVFRRHRDQLIAFARQGKVSLVLSGAQMRVETEHSHEVCGAIPVWRQYRR